LAIDANVPAAMTSSSTLTTARDWSGTSTAVEVTSTAASAITASRARFTS